MLIFQEFADRMPVLFSGDETKRFTQASPDISWGFVARAWIQGARSEDDEGI